MTVQHVKSTLLVEFVCGDLFLRLKIYLSYLLGNKLLFDLIQKKSAQSAVLLVRPYAKLVDIILRAHVPVHDISHGQPHKLALLVQSVSQRIVIADKVTQIQVKLPLIAPVAVPRLGGEYRYEQSLYVLKVSFFSSAIFAHSPYSAM